MNFGFIGDVFFPPACAACGDSVARGILCDPCLQDIARFDTPFCGTCLARLPDGKKICHADAPYLLGAAAPYDDPALAAAIHALKFQGIAAAAAPLAEILVHYVKNIASGPGTRIGLEGYAVTPIPLSPQRRRSRGFNQAELIARPFANALGLAFDAHLLARVAHRRPQSDTEDIFERTKNVKGVFAPAPGAGKKIAGAKIVLVDDVITSGTTFTEAARVLKAAGAKKIFALAVAKA